MLYAERKEATHRSKSGSEPGQLVPIPLSDWSHETSERVKRIDEDLQAFNRKLDQLYQVNPSGVIKLTLPSLHSGQPIIQFKRPASQRRRK